MNQISFFEKRLRAYSTDTLKKAVDDTIAACRFVPVLKDLIDACVKYDREEKLRHRNRKERFIPGDIVDGERTFTPDEARAELERLHKEWPEAFSARRSVAEMATPQDRRRTLQIDVTRLYVSSLRRCARLSPTKAITAATQHDLF